MIRRLCLLIAVLTCIGASPAWAHRLKVFVTAQGQSAAGSVYFAGGGKAARMDGAVFDENGTKAFDIKSDDAGSFSFALPDSRLYRVRFESADGHMAEAMIQQMTALPSSAVLPAALETNSAADVDAAVEAALSRQLRPLREQLDALDSRTRLSDVIGGLGFIVGLFGAAAWVAARRQGGRS